MADLAATNTRIDMSLDEIVRSRGGGRSPRGRGRSFAHGPKPYERKDDFSPVHNSQGPPPPKVDLNVVTNRLYVSNLSYGTSWQDLKDHMRAAGNVLHTEIFSDHLGRSKLVVGIGLDFINSIVEFETRQDAIRALKTLNDTDLGGRLIYLREDREEGFGAPQPRGGGGRIHVGGGARGTAFTAPHFNRPSNAPHPGAGGAGCQLFDIYQLPYTTSWQDLKDHFRPCGNVIRADVLYAPDGRAKGTGVILFETSADARRAITQMDESNFNGRTIYVREDKFQGL